MGQVYDGMEKKELLSLLIAELNNLDKLKADAKKVNGSWKDVIKEQETTVHQIRKAIAEVDDPQLRIFAGGQAAPEK